MTEPPAIQRRAHPRRRYLEPVHATPIGAPDRQARALMAEDLSEGGLAVSTPAFLDVGTRLLMDLEISATGAPIRVTGSVVWVTETAPERYRLGLRFEEPAAFSSQRLRALVDAASR
jgi:Tfp pilus assembly protein PilZ